MTDGSGPEDETNPSEDGSPRPAGAPGRKEASDREGTRFSRRMRRYAEVGAGVGGYAARRTAGRVLGGGNRSDNARELRLALGGLKGPLMKVAQMMATIPDALPPEYAEELSQLQSSAPPMGWPFVRRRMSAELGPDWQSRFAEFGREAAAAASLGQVHRAKLADGRTVACKLQYPEMQSAVDADMRQLSWIFAIHRRMDPAIDTSEMYHEIGERLQEELDYEREARHMQLYARIFADEPRIAVPEVVADLSTRRLLTMTWLSGASLLEHKEDPQEARNAIAETMFTAWWQPFNSFGVIHGDPHLGNYTLSPAGEINLLDYGCIRLFPPRFVAGVVELYRALQADDRERAVAAYEAWGFRGLSHQMVDILNMWARFIYGPMLDDRVRTIADGVSPGEYGRREAFAVHKALKEHGPVTPPREFVFMDRAAIGLGSVFLHLGAELNFHDLFNRSIEGFERQALEDRQRRALESVGLPVPV